MITTQWNDRVAAAFVAYGVQAKIISSDSMDTALLLQWPGGDVDYISQIPSDRHGADADIAEFAAFLGSDYSAFVNCVTVPVVGGTAGLLDTSRV